MVGFLPEKQGDPGVSYSRPLDIAEWRVLMKRPKESATGKLNYQLGRKNFKFFGFRFWTAGTFQQKRVAVNNRFSFGRRSCTVVDYAVKGQDV